MSIRDDLYNRAVESAIGAKQSNNPCANGTPGYRIASGKLVKYLPDRPCCNQKSHGHIFCDRCRREAGGR